MTSAARILHDALEATRADDDAVTGERAQAAVELSYIETDSNRAIELLSQGLRQAPDAQLRELSATFDEIRDFQPSQLARQMQQIAAINLGLVEASDQFELATRVVPSPLWLRSEDDPCKAELAVTMIPGPWLRLYWHGKVRDEIEAGLIPALAAEIFGKLAVHETGIARMAYVVRETEATFGRTCSTSARRATASPAAVPPHVFLASRVLAHVARLRAADLSRAQIAAAFGLNRDHGDVRSAHDKSRRMRVKLAQWTLRVRTPD